MLFCVSLIHMTLFCTYTSRNCAIVNFVILSFIFASVHCLCAFLCFSATYLFVFILIKVVAQCWLLCPYFWLVCPLCLFLGSRVVANIMGFDATVIQLRGSASYKIRFNPLFSTKMPVLSQEYDSWYSFIWCVWAFDFSIQLLGTFRFEFSSEFIFFCVWLFALNLLVMSKTLLYWFSYENGCISSTIPNQFNLIEIQILCPGFAFKIWTPSIDTCRIYNVIRLK